MARTVNRSGSRRGEWTKKRYRGAARKLSRPRSPEKIENNDINHSNHDITHLYGTLGNGERTNRNFDVIQQEADEKYFEWKQIEGKI